MKTQTQAYDDLNDNVSHIDHNVSMRESPDTDQTTRPESIYEDLRRTSSPEKKSAAMQRTARLTKPVQPSLGGANTRTSGIFGSRLARSGTTSYTYVQQEAQENDLGRFQEVIDANEKTCRLERELEEALIKIKEMESEQEATTLALRNVQIQAFKRFDAPGWTPQSDEVINARLSSLDANVKAWAKANSIGDILMLEKLSQSTSSAKLLRALDGFAEPPEGMLFMGLPNDKAWALVQGFVMHQLYEDVFGEPFFGLDNRLQVSAQVKTDKDGPSPPVQHEPKPIKGFVQALQVMYEELLECKCNFLKEAPKGSTHLRIHR